MWEDSLSSTMYPGQWPQLMAVTLLPQLTGDTSSPVTLLLLLFPPSSMMCPSSMAEACPILASLE